MPIIFRHERYFDPRRLRKKGFDYWLRALVVTLLGMLVVRSMAGVAWWQKLRYDGYGLLERVERQPSTPGATAVVLIDDHDYWRGDYARRVPLRRDELAKLVTKLIEHGAAVIALDVDLRSQMPDGSIRFHPLYQPETDTLLRTIGDSPVPIVLKKTVSRVGGRYFADSDVFDASSEGRVAAGYSLVPEDIRQVPLHLKTHDGRTVMSFAMAVARAKNSDRVRDAESLQGESLPYGRFYSQNAFRHYTLSARQVLAAAGKGTLPEVEHRAVIIGGGWHREAFGRGELIDVHVTPVGPLPGALLHANYVETILEGRGRKPISHWLETALEIAFAALLAIIFVAGVRHWKFVLLALCGLLSLALSIVFWQNFGAFIDGVPLVVLLGAHAAIEQVIHWRDVAVKCTGH
jgi:CHASE2 domain-containing sensor protein